MKSIQSVSVFGLGKLGACIAATLAERGFEVVGVDINPETVRLVNEGRPPVAEPLLAETMAASGGRLTATTDPSGSVRTDASFFIPPSPSLPDGSFSSEFLLRAMQTAARAVREAGKKGHLFVVNSTTTPGSMDTVIIPMLEKELGGRQGVDFGVCYNPEFIALGNVVKGLLEPDMVLIGESDRASGDALEALYRRYNRNRPNLARMSIVSAELTKISVNSYITMKISFTNQLRLIAERMSGADAGAILDAIGSDSRIGRKYLRPGLSYGGPCFPRDNRLVAHVAKSLGLEAPLAEASDRVNEATKQQLLKQVQSIAAEGETVAILGMAYKPDTYITEESAGLFLAQKLKRSGRRVLVHDFAANPANSPALIEFEAVEDLETLLKDSTVKAAVIACPWPGYTNAAFNAHVKVFAPWG